MEDEKCVYEPKDRKMLSPKTYITKEKFVEMINTLDFKYIEKADIEFITGFLYKADEDKIEPKGYKINMY